MSTTRSLGWRPGPIHPELRSTPFRDRMVSRAVVPRRVNLKGCLTDRAFDQGALGSCTAQALAGLHVALQKRHEVPAPFIPSRLWIYYNERAIEGSVADDAGAALADGVHVLQAEGAPRESLWTYDVAKFAVRPNRGVAADATRHRIADVVSLDNSLDQMRACLAVGFPFVFGVTVYASFVGEGVADSGVVPLPDPGREELAGGHALVAYGYDDVAGVFLVRNSWGPHWGLAGDCHFPYAYLEDAALAADLWSARALA